MLILNENHMRSILRMKDVIDAVEDGFRRFDEARLPERMHVPLPEQSAILLLMPAHLGSSERGSALGAKIVSVFEKNSEQGLEIVQGIYILLDGDTGAPLALMDGRFITAIRTAATSAVATRFMATEGRKRLAVFGAGVQAEFHIEAMLAVTEIERILIASRTEEKALRLSEITQSRFDIECEITSAETIALEADLICTCTSASTPLFDGSKIRAGTHINAVGAFTPLTRELDTATVTRSRVIIDAESAAGREAGEIMIPISEGAITADHIKGSLAQVVNNQVEGRTSKDEITLFKSCGLALEDLVTAKLAYRQAIQNGIGIDVPM